MESGSAEDERLAHAQTSARFGPPKAWRIRSADHCHDSVSRPPFTALLLKIFRVNPRTIVERKHFVTMSHHHASRPRQKPLGNEEAGANLSLGEFTDDYALSNSEARLLINTIVDRQRQLSPNYKESEALMRTNDHLDLFARYKNPAAAEQLETTLRSATNLASFERSQLGK